MARCVFGVLTKESIRSFGGKGFEGLYSFDDILERSVKYAGILEGSEALRVYIFPLVEVPYPPSTVNQSGLVSCGFYGANNDIPVFVIYRQGRNVGSWL